jgi:hypothetical protein
MEQIEKFLQLVQNLKQMFYSHSVHLLLEILVVIWQNRASTLRLENWGKMESLWSVIAIIRTDDNVEK